MPRRAKEMRPLQIRKLAKPGCHAVGGCAGLYLQVTPTGAKSWVLRIVIGARRREFGLGSYPTVSLELARDKARNMRAQIEAGADPAAERREKREALRAATAHRVTFAEAAEQFLAIKCAELKTEKQAAQWRKSLEQYVYPIIGSKALADVTLPDVLLVLEPIWTERTATASLIRNRIENVISWAKVKGYLAGENVARWKGNLEVVLAKPSKIVRTAHRAAMPAADLPNFLQALSKRKGSAATALQMVILSGLRSSEVRLAQWSEFNFDKAEWTIPGERMKSGLEHVVPISGAMKQLLDAVPRQGAHVFVGRGDKPLAESALRNVMRKLDRSETVHGFRSSFKDWARTEHPEIPDEVSELQLAHVSNDATRAAYARDKLVEQRRALLELWDAHCNGVAPAQAEAA